MMPVKGRRYTLVDVSGLIYQALQSPTAISMSSHTKVPLAGQIFVLTKMLLKLAVHRPLIFVLDGYPKWRFDLYPNYQKAGEGGRSSYAVKKIANGDENLYRKMKQTLFAYVCCYPTWFVKSASNQADDTIAWLIETNPHMEFDVYTRDMDLAALVRPNVRMIYIPPKGTQKIFATADDVKREVGVFPNQFRVYKAWLGDDSDNLIRVPNIRKQLVIDQIICDATTLSASLENLENNRMNLVKTQDWYEVCQAHLPNAQMNYEVAGFNVTIEDTQFHRYPGQALSDLQALYRRYAIQSIDPVEVVEAYQIHNQMQCFLDQA